MTDDHIIHNADQQRFETNLADAGLALLEYRRRGQQIIYTHTEVPSASEGHGIASGLAKFALDYARDNHLEVVPLCKFVVAYIRHHPEYLPLVSPGHRNKIEPDAE
jgi:predicted GNAT family acetyltransferase